MSDTTQQWPVEHGPWKDGAGLQWRIVETPTGPQVQAQTGQSNAWEFVGDRQPAGAVSRRIAAEFMAERGRLREQIVTMLLALRQSRSELRRGLQRERSELSRACLRVAFDTVEAAIKQATTG